MSEKITKSAREGRMTKGEKENLLRIARLNRDGPSPRVLTRRTLRLESSAHKSPP